MSGTTRTAAVLGALLAVAAGPAHAAAARPALELALQRRDPKTGKVVVTKATLDPSKIGVVVVDLWNFHWCKTAAERVGALVPRMNRTLEAVGAFLETLRR